MKILLTPFVISHNPPTTLRSPNRSLQPSLISTHKQTALLLTIITTAPHSTQFPGAQWRRMEEAIGPNFTAPDNACWRLMFDAVQPYNSVNHSTYVLAIACDDLPDDTYARNNNFRVLALVPGPKAPENLKAVFINTLAQLRRAAGDPPPPSSDPAEGAEPSNPAVPMVLRVAEEDGTYSSIAHIPYLTTAFADRMATIKVDGCLGPSARLSCHYCINESAKFTNAGGGTTYRPAGYVDPVPQVLRFGGNAMKMDDDRLHVDNAM